MFKKLSARIRNTETDLRLLVPLLVCTVLVQMDTALLRITTSYRAVELGLSTVWLGLIAAAFALFPIIIAVGVGRMIDRGHDALATWIGSGFFMLGCAGFMLSPSVTVLMVSTVVMGAGHLMLGTSQQMLCMRAAPPGKLESVFGNYMVAGAIGQAIGPFVVGWVGGSAKVPPTQDLFMVGLGVTIVILVLSLAIRPQRDRPKAASDSEITPIRELLHIPGLVAVVAAGVIMVAGSDIIIIYVPLLGAERNIDVSVIGWLLTMRAASSMTARLFYARLVTMTGRWPLMIGSTAACALAFAAMSLPLPLPGLFAVMMVMGFSFGLATTLSITIVVDMTKPSVRGTANSLRMMSNRLGQFVVPAGAGLVAAATGLFGLLLITAAAIAVSAAAMHIKRPAQPAE